MHSNDKVSCATVQISLLFSRPPNQDLSLPVVSSPSVKRTEKLGGSPRMSFYPPIIGEAVKILQITLQRLLSVPTKVLCIQAGLGAVYVGNAVDPR